MTDSHPFFRFVWRANAVLILGLTVFVGLFVAYQLGREVLRSMRPAYRAPDQGLATPLPRAEGPEAPPQEVLHVGQFARAHGEVFHAPVYSGRPGDAYKYSSVKGGGERVRNVVMFDARTGAISRLFGDDKGRILDEDIVDRSRDDWPRNRTLARVYVYVAADTNGDGRVDAGDRQRIFVTRPDGSGPILLAEDVDRYGAASPSQGSETILAYFIRRGGELTYGEFDLETFEPRRAVPVAVPRT